MYYVIYCVHINNGSPLMFLCAHLNLYDIHCGAGILSFPPPSHREPTVTLVPY